MVPGFRALLAAVTASWLVLRLSSAGFACLSNPCVYGICIDDLNSSYTCYCIDGYTGIHCQTNWDECWSSPCLNGGTCHDGIAAFNCSCLPGFLGDLCEENVDECSSNPCHNNATCMDVANGYSCLCLPGYSGVHCEVDISVCNSTEEAQCHNGAMCVEGPGMTFTCICTPGWKGKQCEEAKDECASNPCQNGAVCIDLPAGYACACLFGFTGHNCDTELQICEMSPCENNALCLNEDGMSVCYCVPDFHGDHCQFQYDECQLEPRCWNGGTCIDGVDNYTCSCPPKLTGRHCECLILDDNQLDCTYKLTTLELPFTTTHYFKSTTESTVDDRLSPTTHFIITTESPVSYVPTTESTLSIKTENISKSVLEYTTLTSGITEFVDQTTLPAETELSTPKFFTETTTEYFTSDIFSNLSTFSSRTDLVGTSLFTSSITPRLSTDQGLSETTMFLNTTESTISEGTEIIGTTESVYPQVRTDHEIIEKASTITTEEPLTTFIPSLQMTTERTDKTFYHSTPTEITTSLTSKHITEPSEHPITAQTVATVPVETTAATSIESTIEYSTPKIVPEITVPEISTHFYTPVTTVESETDTSYGIDVDCSKLPCLNGGTCVVEKGLAKCSCRFGWTGFHCEEQTG